MKTDFKIHYELVEDELSFREELLGFCSDGLGVALIGATIALTLSLYVLFVVLMG